MVRLVSLNLQQVDSRHIVRIRARGIAKDLELIGIRLIPPPGAKEGEISERSLLNRRNNGN
jgi:hypothetical protein